MRVFALVGKSGTGKSYNAISVAKENGIECIIDDGLLIADNKIYAGSSAKKEKTKIASVKHAIFYDKSYADEMKNAVKNLNPKAILVLGTSEKMVNQIRERLGFPGFEKYIKIEDISSAEEIKTALKNRKELGMHIIPVPTPEVRRDFSGYFIHSLKTFQKKFAVNEVTEKTIMRPTYSYLGDFTVSDNVISQMMMHEMKKLDFVTHVNYIIIDKLNNGIGTEISVSLKYGTDIQNALKKIKQAASMPVCQFASINVIYVNLFVKSLTR